MTINSVAIFKVSFSLTYITQSKSHQLFSEMNFVPVSLPSEHLTQCFEFQWITRKGRMGSDIWKWLWKLIVLQKYASFSLPNSSTKQWYWNRCQTKQWRKQCKYELHHHQPKYSAGSSRKVQTGLYGYPEVDEVVCWGKQYEIFVYTYIFIYLVNISKIWYHWKLAGLKLLKCELTAERSSF